jgi:hypothetical protein
LPTPASPHRGDDATGAVADAPEVLEQHRELTVPVDQRRRVGQGGHRAGGSVRRTARLAERRARQAVLEQVVIQRLGVRLGLDVQLTAQDLRAQLVLPQRGRPVALGGVEAHEGAMDAFLERIEG